MEGGIQFYAWVESIISPEHMPSEVQQVRPYTLQVLRIFSSEIPGVGSNFNKQA
mgnify:CR=1 FL=1